MGNAYPRGLICIDPGLNTGLSVLTVDGPNDRPVLREHTTIHYGTSGAGSNRIFEQVDDWYSYFWHKEDRFVDIVLEKFTKRPGVVDPELTAIKVMGVLDLWWFQKGQRMRSKFHERIPVQGKHAVKNDVLRRVGVHLPGHNLRHINDATRHGISLLIDQRHLGTCEAAHPREDDDG